ncbi:GNAT family N-acetyltransferase [Bacillus sp. SB49]|uniref:GNAT family N-acetyltransferase n=1 Tax=Bacillaceae TaxID=186817 RepID=UPI0003F8D61E|nr:MULTISPECIES: GNAT family N-acetyltransferase [Bacillaceae]QHT46973.1 GNAT family N-acetyltransferase [Bacillus sp. SB49]
MNIYKKQETAKGKWDSFFKDNWDSPYMIVSSGIYDCRKLDGFTYVGEKAEIIGLITYVESEEEVEIVSLDSLREGRGIGSLLIDRVESVADGRRIKVITTNENIHAIRFYQRRGFRLKSVVRGAVEKARLVKPSIPRFSSTGIPILDEIVLVKGDGER